MRKLVFSLVAIFFSFHSNAQTTTFATETTDSLINVIAYFCKNDSLEYVMNEGEVNIEAGDTTISDRTEQRFRIVVLDSTSNGYKMELIPLSYEYEESGDKAEVAINKIAAATYKDFHTIFTTDEYGIIQHIENWKEIRDISNSATKRVCDSLYAMEPDMETYLPRKRFESLMKSMLSTEDKILNSYSELTMLFSCHGKAFPIGKKIADGTSESGYPQHTEVVASYGSYEEEYGFEDDFYVSFAAEETIPAKDAVDIVSNFVGIITDKDLDTEAKDKLVDEAKSDMKRISVEDNYFFFNGWPCKVLKNDITEWEGVKKIKYSTIQWAKRSWGNFEQPSSTSPNKEL